jgi:FtsZ-binding cell division protein ZapB
MKSLIPLFILASAFLFAHAYNFEDKFLDLDPRDSQVLTAVLSMVKDLKEENAQFKNEIRNLKVEIKDMKATHTEEISGLKLEIKELKRGKGQDSFDYQMKNLEDALA